MSDAHRRLLFCAAATVVLAGGSTLALADAGPAPAPSGLLLVDLPQTKAKQDGVTFSTRDDATVASFTLTYGPRSESGWHAHPGVVIAVVEKGTVTRQVGCEMKTFGPGDAFTEVEPHLVKNAYTGPETGPEHDAVLRITHVLPADAPSRRLPAEAPVC